MPNHITTVATVTGPAERVEAFRVAHIRPTEERAHNREHFDFETIIPMPQSIKDTMRPFDDKDRKPDEPKGSCGDAEVEFYAEACLKNPREFIVNLYPWLPADVKRWGDMKVWLEKQKPVAAFYGKRALVAAAETGYSGWYEWSCANWGTKWGSYDYEERSREPGRFVFAFETAWSPPRPILAKLAEMWPELRIETKSIDEGGGAWSGSGGNVEETEETRELHMAVYGNTERIDPDPDEADAS
jgi:hypothetical protein